MLAIGIVVDDAIVVVENVERNIGLGLKPVEATKRAMREVTGPIIATALVLCAVFIPTAFISGLTGQFYRQFALTIAISTVISAFNSLTLSPALAAVLLKGHHEPKDRFSVFLDKLLGSWLFRPFNRFFDRASHGYVGTVNRVLRGSSIALLVYGGLMVLTYFGFSSTPTGFVPQQDKQYLVAFAQLPDAASLDRTEAVIKQMSEIALAQPGVADSVAFPGLSINGFTNSPNSGIVFTPLKPFDERKDPSQSAGAIAAALNAKYADIQDAYIAIFPPPPVQGWGPSAASACRSRTVATRATRSCSSRPRTSSPRPVRCLSWNPARCSPATRSTCRRSTPTSTARRPRPTAWRSATSSTPCRSTSARCTRTTSTASAVPIRSTSRPSSSSASNPSRSAS